MESLIVRLNIELLSRQLETETDETKRRMLVRLLSEAQAKLAAVPNNAPDKTGIRRSVSGHAIFHEA